MTFTVDIHHHMLPDFFWRATNEGDHPVDGIAPPPWSRASALSFLDNAGIDVAVTSVSTPGVHTGDDAAARVLARRCNELAAEMIRDRPDRFGGFACLPLPDVDGALAELGYALDDLQLDGVVLFSNARGRYLGDPRFTPLFDELQRRAALVFVHPNPSPDPSAHALGLPDSLIDFTADTTRAIAQLHYSNTFARTPDVKYVFSHAGGTVPYLAGRSASSTRCTSSPEPRPGPPRPRRSAACTGTPPCPGVTPCCACCVMSRESTACYSAPTTPTCAATWRSPAASTSRPAPSSPTASGWLSSAALRRR